MRKLLSVLAAGLALCLTACAAANGFSGGERLSDGIKSETDVSVTYNYAQGANDPPLSYNNFANTVTAFTLKLFRSAYADGCDALTPVNSVLQLGLLANGAKGDTRTEILLALGAELDLDALNACCSYFKSRMNTVGKAALSEKEERDAPLTLSGTFFFNDDNDVRRAFLQTNADYYADDLIRYDFRSGAEKLRDYLGGDSFTLGAADSMASRTGLSLTDRWLNPSLRAEEYVMESKTARGVIKYTADNPLKALFIQPDGSLDDYAKTFDSAELGRLLDSVDVTKRSDTVIPAFHTEAWTTELSSYLAKNGLYTLFDEDADFGYLTHTDSLRLSAFYDCTPALSVTADGINTGADVTGAATADEAVNIQTPFLFLLVDNETGIPVYIAAIK